MVMYWNDLNHREKQIPSNGQVVSGTTLTTLSSEVEKSYSSDISAGLPLENSLSRREK